MATFLGSEDKMDLARLVWANGNTMLPKRRREHFARAYNVSLSCVTHNVIGIIKSSEKDSRGNYFLTYRITTGTKVTGNFVEEVRKEVDNSKLTGNPVDYVKLVKLTRMTLDAIHDLVSKII